MNSRNERITNLRKNTISKPLRKHSLTKSVFGDLFFLKLL
jgi:hypothetical protein